MMTITEFLEARIAEDEARAVEARDWVANGPTPYFPWYGAPGDRAERVLGGAHPLISAMSPARVLAECAAKRAIIELHKAVKWTLPNMDAWPLEYWHDSDGMITVKKDGQWVERMTFAEYCERFNLTPNLPDKELLALAAVYADHADYRQEWAPMSG